MIAFRTLRDIARSFAGDGAAHRRPHDAGVRRFMDPKRSGALSSFGSRLHVAAQQILRSCSIAAYGQGDGAAWRECVIVGLSRNGAVPRRTPIPEPSTRPDRLPIRTQKKA
jgi:hypothetical protein